MADRGWKMRFEEPIELPDGRKLKTLAEAMAWLEKEVPKSEALLPGQDFDDHRIDGYHSS